MPLKADRSKIILNWARPLRTYVRRDSLITIFVTSKSVFGCMIEVRWQGFDRMDTSLHRFAIGIVATDGFAARSTLVVSKALMAEEFGIFLNASSAIPSQNNLLNQHSRKSEKRMRERSLWCKIIWRKATGDVTSSDWQRMDSDDHTFSFDREKDLLLMSMCRTVSCWMEIRGEACQGECRSPSCWPCPCPISSAVRDIIYVQS